MGLGSGTKLFTMTVPTRSLIRIRIKVWIRIRIQVRVRDWVRVKVRDGIKVKVSVSESFFARTQVSRKLLIPQGVL